MVRRLFEIWQVEGVSRVFTIFAEIKDGFAFDRHLCYGCPEPRRVIYETLD